ncbi:MAG: hypothetical protein AAF938_10905 [Myxococcota bacterium]
MGWEPVETWPAQGRDSAFRSQADGIVAERRGVRPFERLILWWQSTPELPFGKVFQDLVVTQRYLYARRLDGTERRVRREQIKAGQSDRPIRHYAVAGGGDFVLPNRGGDAVERALTPDAYPKGWSSRSHWEATLVFLVAGCALTAALSHAFLQEGSVAVSAGRYNSESAYWFYGLALAWLALASATFLLPSRVVADASGLHLRRGFWGFRKIVPVPEIRFVEVRCLHSANAMGRRYPVHVFVEGRDAPLRLPTPEAYRRTASVDIATRCAECWNVELKLDRSHKLER